ncbi:MAG: hypothetical protein EAZ85_02470 [Bacteroidetes bacterium]|nr:MAG: hypothetical protein EAZ85_02470 [Bacteroidota bacterium]TAG88307.1 MAG: hypothetical protein EAZ20_08855 [Bacteroidota bacterium]
MKKIKMLLLCIVASNIIYAQQPQKKSIVTPKKTPIVTKKANPITKNNNFKIESKVPEPIKKNSTKPIWNMIALRLITYHQILLENAKKEIKITTENLVKLRQEHYQYRIYLTAKQWEGKNLYHDFGWTDKEKNDDDNTCVNGWCQVMAGTGIENFKNLVEEPIQFREGTIQIEKRKQKPNLWQRKPKYIHVAQILKRAEEFGFTKIDLDMTQRGDFAIQYYRKKRGKIESYTAQHISIVDKIVMENNESGNFELRDWHEGVEDEPFIYRTGYNKPSSYNNLFTFENVYYGFQNETGKERKLTGKNPNVSQGYAYFGENVEKAKEIIEQINALRGQIYMLEQIQKNYKF